MPLRLNNERIEAILAYCNEHGETETCTHFGINIESLHRYMREKRWRETQQPKILLLDMETTPLLVRSWGIWNVNIPHTSIIEDWFFLSWSAKWLFEADVMSDVLSPKEAVHKDDKRICQSLWPLLNEADITITHNGVKFDNPKILSRFLIHGMNPPMPYLQIDTLKIAKRHFAFTSNKLDYIAKILLGDQKIKTDYSLWEQCLAGDQQALLDMETYNKKDVLLLEEIYLKFRPFIKSHPNLAVLMDATEPCCPNCGGFEFEDGKGYYTTPQNRYISVRCKSCGAVNRKKDSDLKLTAAQRKQMIVPTAR
jgi:DNA polymerase III epsilon subunit-like protein